MSQTRCDEAEHLWKTISTPQDPYHRPWCSQRPPSVRPLELKPQKQQHQHVPRYSGKYECMHAGKLRNRYSYSFRLHHLWVFDGINLCLLRWLGLTYKGYSGYFIKVFVVTLPVSHRKRRVQLLFELKRIHVCSIFLCATGPRILTSTQLNPFTRVWMQWNCIVILILGSKQRWRTAI